MSRRTVRESDVSNIQNFRTREFGCAVAETFLLNNFLQRRAGWNVTFPLGGLVVDELILVRPAVELSYFLTDLLSRSFGSELAHCAEVSLAAC